MNAGCRGDAGVAGIAGAVSAARAAVCCARVAAGGPSPPGVPYVAVVVGACASVELAEEVDSLVVVDALVGIVVAAVVGVVVGAVVGVVGFKRATSEPQAESEWDSDARIASTSASGTPASGFTGVAA